MLRRYLYLKLLNDAPIEIKFFTDRSAGLKYVAEQANIGPILPEAYWDDALKRARVGTMNTPASGCMHWLYEVEIY